MLRTALRSEARTIALAFAAASVARDESPSPGYNFTAAEKSGDFEIDRLNAIRLQRLFSSKDRDSPLQYQGLHNSILTIPCVVSPTECGLLRDEADCILDSGEYSRDRYCDSSSNDDSEDEPDSDSSLRRVSVCDMSVSAQKLSEEVITRRVLPLLRAQMPHLCRHFGFETFDAQNAVFEWAADEPSVNRYNVGGEFEAHRDGYTLTIIILLSKEGSFVGGGTEFLEPDESGGERDTNERKSILIQPPQGAAILFDGDITHSGSPVISGVRHLYVASFSLGDKVT